MKAWRRDLHKWDVMDNIAQITLPQPPMPSSSSSITTASANSSAVESGEIVSGGAGGYGSWADSVPVVRSVQVVAPIAVLSSNNQAAAKSAASKNKVKLEAADVSDAAERGRVFGEDVYDPSLAPPSPAAQPASSGLIGEDTAAIDGIDYDCEAPFDSDEDVL